MAGVPRQHTPPGPGIGASLAGFWSDIGPVLLRDMQTLPERAGSALMQPVEALDRFGRTLMGQEGGYAMELDPSGRVVPSQQLFDDASTLGGLAQMNPAVPMNAFGMGFKAYHGTPHSFDKFDISKIGSGEGAQAYGHGLYFAENPSVARSYRDILSPPDISYEGKPYNGAITLIDNKADPQSLALSAVNNYRGDIDAALKALNRDGGRDGASESVKARWRAAKWLEANRAKVQVSKSNGNLYEVDIDAEPEHLLDWDKPISKQSPFVQEALKKAGINLTDDQLGQTAWKRASQRVNADHSISHSLPQDASERLRGVGIKGIKYKDGGSRGPLDNPTHNYVMFHHDPVKIIGKLET